MIIKKEELEKLGKENLKKYSSDIVNEYKDMKYLNPLFVGCYMKYLEVLKHIEDVNGYNRMLRYLLGFKKYDMKKFGGTAVNIYDVVVRDGYLDMSFLDKYNKLDFDEQVALRQKEIAKERKRIVEQNTKALQEETKELKKLTKQAEKLLKIIKKKEKYLRLNKDDEEFLDDMEMGMLNDE